MGYQAIRYTNLFTHFLVEVFLNISLIISCICWKLLKTIAALCDSRNKCSLCFFSISTLSSFNTRFLQHVLFRSNHTNTPTGPVVMMYAALHVCNGGRKGSRKLWHKRDLCFMMQSQRNNILKNCYSMEIACSSLSASFPKCCLS